MFDFQKLEVYFGDRSEACPRATVGKRWMSKRGTRSLERRFQESIPLTTQHGRFALIYLHFDSHQCLYEFTLLAANARSFASCRDYKATLPAAKEKMPVHYDTTPPLHYPQQNVPIYYEIAAFRFSS